MKALVIALILVFNALLSLAQEQVVLKSLPVEHQISNLVYRWKESKPPNTCGICLDLLYVVKTAAIISKEALIEASINICKAFGGLDNEVCEGAVKEQAPVFIKAIRTMEVYKGSGRFFCAAVLNVCPYPDVKPWNVTFPKPKPDENREPIRSEAKTFNMLHLSDWHIDPEYQPDTEVNCKRPICCRADSTDFTNITKKASMWGEYNCDTPLSLIESMLNHIPIVQPNIELGILTGDVPPHEIWSTLPFIKTQLIHEKTYEILHEYFDSPYLINATLYPAVGNHESAPSNNFPIRELNYLLPGEKHLDLGWLYDSLAHSWKGWLSSDAHYSVKDNSASYTARPMPGLKLISINTNFCYNMNWWLYEQPTTRDPNGILDWLINELQDAEDRNERVWIIGHISPGDSSCFHDYSNYYTQIIERYSDSISAQFFGHTHRDEHTIFYRNGKDQTAENAISIAYLGPSVTPFEDVNPGFRIYKVDTKTFEIVDSLTYIADLEKATDIDHEPDWYLEYSAREAYNSTRAYLDRLTSPLSPAWWHNVSVDMEQNDSESFRKYRRFMYKSAEGKECDDECKANTICTMRAGQSQLRCDYMKVPFQQYKSEPNLCGPLLARNHKK